MEDLFKLYLFFIFKRLDYGYVHPDILLAFFSFLAGVFAASIFSFPLPIITWIVCITAAACFISSIYKPGSRILLIAFAAIAFLFGGYRMDITKESDRSLDDKVGQKASLVGSVCDEPRKKETTQSFCFVPFGTNSRVLVTAGRYPAYEYGETLAISGKLDLPENFETYAGGPEFDYVSYLGKDGIRYTMFRPEIEAAGEDGGDPIMNMLFGVKGAFIEQMQDLFPEPESSLLGGLLLGDRGSLPKDITEEFKVAGLVHILVLSGYNVTIVAESLMKAFSFLPQTFGRGMGALSIVLFALMTGASATTIRASIMALIVILARSTSRRYDVARALFAAAFLMVLHNPSILAFDVSFQLSFLATLALVYVSPLVEDKLSWVTERWNIREILSTTIATQAFVLPFLVYTMGQVSLISLLTNILVLPFVPYVMLGGFVSIVLGFISSVLAAPLAWVSGMALSYMLFVASVSSKVPFAAVYIKTGAFALVFMYILYAALLIRAWRRRNSSPSYPNSDS